MAIAGLLELHAVELRVGEPELDDRRQLGQLPAPEPDFPPEVGHPSLDELGGADVVVVDELQARVRGNRVRSGRADRGLVADPLTLAPL